MKVVAEGIEDEEQLQFLKEQGCDLAQGFYISKPMNMETYLGWLQSWPHGIQQETVSNIVPLNPPVKTGTS
jgi:EAL domain-containing protein (putative c-di-GMP-specific phosphodiesterase class I)